MEPLGDILVHRGFGDSEFGRSAPDRRAGDAEYAVILKVLSSQYWQTMRDGIEAKAEELGINCLLYTSFQMCRGWASPQHLSV